MTISEIIYSPHFVRAFKKTSKNIQVEIQEREVWFRADCFDPRLKTHKLSGKLDGFWAFSITKKHRILFSFEETGTVTFIDTDDHDLYR